MCVLSTLVAVIFINITIFTFLLSSNKNEVIRAVLYTHLHTQTHKVLTSYVSLVYIYKQIVWSENFISYILSVIVGTLKIFINLINHKNAYKQTKTKKAVCVCNKTPAINVKHEFFKNSFFISTKIECNKSDWEIKNSESMGSFNKIFLSFIRPSLNSTFNCPNPKGIEFL